MSSASGAETKKFIPSFVGLRGSKSKLSHIRKFATLLASLTGIPANFLFARGFIDPLRQYSLGDKFLYFFRGVIKNSACETVFLARIETPFS